MILVLMIFVGCGGVAAGAAVYAAWWAISVLAGTAPPTHEEGYAVAVLIGIAAPLLVALGLGVTILRDERCAASQGRP